MILTGADHMVESLVQTVKDYFIPGSFELLILGLLAGLAMLYHSERGWRWGRRWLAALCLSYALLSTPWVSAILERGLATGLDGPRPVEEIRPVEAIVILGGGAANYRASGNELNMLSDSTVLRVLEGARIYHALDQPYVIVTGGDNLRAGQLVAESIAMQHALIQLGIEPERIRLETESRRTHDHPARVEPLLNELGVESFALVTSPIHMRRSMAVFEKQGLTPRPAPASQHADGHMQSRIGWLPAADALNASRNVFREVLALVFYWLRGWI
jgi:uncharacterized SAM-binding protein YcdF (DUF218 family)